MFEILSSLSEIFPWIEIKHRSNRRGPNTGVSSAKLVVDMDISEPWLVEPNPDSSKNKIGIWGNNVVFPTSDKNIVPNDKKEGLPLPISYEFNKINLEAFFKGSTLVRDQKVQLPRNVFDPSSITMSKNDNFHIIDSLLRKAIGEIGVVDKFILALMEFVNSWSTSDDEEINLELFADRARIVASSLSITSMANLRARQFCTAAFTNNKLKFRQNVLDRCFGQNQTKEILKLTSLSTPGLFGPLPESFAKRLDAAASSVTNNYMLRPKAFNTNSNKRQQPASSGSYTKKVKYDNISHYGQSSGYGNNNNSQFFQHNQKPQRGKGAPRRPRGRGRFRRR